MSEKVFYFMFSSGEYSDYSVGPICVCDHSVTSKDWSDHLQKYREERSKRGWEARGFATWEDWYDAGGHEKLTKWEAKNVPENTFQMLHKMRVLPMAVLHNDS